jgi:hypothetical protein
MIQMYYDILISKYKMIQLHTHNYNYYYSDMYSDSHQSCDLIEVVLHAAKNSNNTFIFCYLLSHNTHIIT